MSPFVFLVPIFWVGYFLNPAFFWLHWVAFAWLFFLYQSRRRMNFLKSFLLPCWVVFLGVYAACFYWILTYDDGIYVLAVSAFSLFFPLFFLLHHFLTLKIRSKVLEVAIAFVIFWALAWSLSRVPALESVGLDFFFQPPAAALCVLKFMSFKVWSAWVFATCFAIACLIREKKFRHFLILGALLGGMAALFILAHIQNKISWNEKGTVKIALVQNNLEYSDSLRIEHPEEIEQKYRELALKAAQGAPDLIIFPLYTLPGDVYRKPAFFENMAKLAKCPILIASHVPIKVGDEVFPSGIFPSGFMNLAFLYNEKGSVRDIYQAVETLPFIAYAAEKAKKYRVIQGPFGKLGVLLCYEDMIPRLSQEAKRGGAKALVALSNPGLLQKTPMLYYQLLQDQIRAAETGLPLLRVSPNGYSAWIDRTGKIVKQTELDTEEILWVELPGFEKDSLFEKTDLFDFKR